MHTRARMAQAEAAVAPHGVGQRDVARPNAIAAELLAHCLVQCIFQLHIAAQLRIHLAFSLFARLLNFSMPTGLELVAVQRICQGFERQAAVGVNELLAGVGLVLHCSTRIDTNAPLGQRQLVLHGFVAAQARAHNHHGIAARIHRRAGALQIECSQTGRMIFGQHATALHGSDHANAHLD